jgi:hypothetical protein
MELCDGQSKPIDDFELREDFGLVADLFGIQIVGHADTPMLRARLVRSAWRVELIESNKGRSVRHRRTLDGLHRHRGNGDVLDLDLARLDMPAHDLRDEAIGIVFGHELRGQSLGEEVVVERVLAI